MIPFTEAFELETQNAKIQTATVIPPSVEHKVKSNGPQLTILLSPTTSQGHYWKAHLKSEPSSPPESELVELKEVISEFLSGNVDQSECVQRVNHIIESWNCQCSGYVHQGDDRIEKALNYLAGQEYRNIPISEVAQHVNLSASRFQHLFTEQTGQTYRRAQLWMKIVSAAPLFGKLSLTEIAHEVGFADSAHLSRSFTETFGFSPRQITQMRGAEHDED